MNDYKNLPDNELVVLLKNNDAHAFEALYDRYAHRIYASILKMVNDTDTTQEFVQDVFMKVWEKRMSINEELSFRSYLFQIAKHLVYNHFRKSAIEKQVQNYLISIRTELHTEVQDHLDYKQSKAILDQVIDQLPPQRKLIYTLCKIEGKSYEEVSQLLNISPSTVRDHIVKATRFIKERFNLSDGSAAVIFVLLALSK